MLSIHFTTSQRRSTRRWTVCSSSRSAPGDWAVVCLARPGRVVLDAPFSSFPAQWVDPATGERTAIKPHGQSVTTPDGWDDAVLILQR